MSGWTQALCDICWDKLNPRRMPVRMIQPVREACYVCGDLTESGIYVRVKPREEA